MRRHTSIPDRAINGIAQFIPKNRKGQLAPSRDLPSSPDQPVRMTMSIRYAMGTSFIIGR